MRIRFGGWWRNSIIAASVALSALLPSGAMAEAPRASAAAGQTVPSAAVSEQRQQASKHFLFRYDPTRLDAATLQAAIDAAEEGYARCARVFPVGALPRRITVDLTPSFVGATGFAVPEEYAISIRVPDLEYLGLRLGYVMTHEVAHVFTHAELDTRGAGAAGAVGPWGEGLADYAAGGFGEIPLADWWGPALRSGNLWADTDWLVSGASTPRVGEFVRERTSTYAQPALLARHLANTAGREALFAFYADYTRMAAEQRKARRREHRVQTAAERGALDDLFRTHFGSGGEEILAQWRQILDAAEAPAGPAERLALHQQVYGSIREFEMRYARGTRRREMSDVAAGRVREEFRLANRSLRGGDLGAAARHLARARTLFAPRHPAQSTVAAWEPTPSSPATAGDWPIPTRPAPATPAAH